MNKSELIDALAARYEGNRKQAAHALESVLDTITREVAKGEKVAITGFGSFEKAVRNARWVRNPQTGERMKSKKKSVPKFSAGKELKDVISGSKKLPRLTAATMPKPPGVRAAASAVTGAATKKSAPAKPTTSKSTAAKKSSTAKSTASKTTTAKKSTAKKAGSSTAKTASKTASKTTASKAPAKKTATKSTASTSTSSSTAKKAPAKKTTTKKTTAKKSTAKKS
ncbi:HU family DNA-binding protein [Nocardioides sp. zg-1228]|uniref:HU family DNA-binding protein n=1 Tax=Nocardioides sp. zg-1228 TaxID=2763008 RepID=UPI0016423ECC|nr:HU family DNA-binding protein [Nocardioides sp. zg-1228]MBC2933334.1 HU family DNA-binding protein [Nocardioides sp. zg-1228]QSF56507.1 HU family DNA-binding protein [Nocardioides sp. zg-1228]